MATIRVCDICGSRDSVNKVEYLYGREGSLENSYETFDLCSLHEAQTLKSSIADALKVGVRTTLEMNEVIVRHTKALIKTTKKKSIKR